MIYSLPSRRPFRLLQASGIVTSGSAGNTCTSGHGSRVDVALLGVWWTWRWGQREGSRVPLLDTASFPACKYQLPALPPAGRGQLLPILTNTYFHQLKNCSLSREFPGGPVFRTCCFHYQCLGLIPGQRTKGFLAWIVKHLPAMQETQV